jgi:uncharacterized protein (DUF342 family)
MKPDNVPGSDLDLVEMSPDGLKATLRLLPGADSRASQVAGQVSKLKVHELVVEGTLSDPWRLRSGASITVIGAVEAAMINAKGSIQIQGGVLGKDKGKCITEQSFAGRFLSHACVIAERDVTLSGEAIESKVVCGGKLTVVGGPIVGGRISANNGVVCDTIGNLQEVRTIVEVGTNQIVPLISAMARIEIDANSQRVRDIREKIGPLLQNLKSLTAQQRERATELHYEADELEEQTNAKTSQLEDRCRLIREAAREEIAVNCVVYPGVTFRFARLETVIRAALKGPFKIVTRNIGGTNEVVLIEVSSAVEHILESRRHGETADNQRNDTTGLNKAA